MISVLIMVILCLILTLGNTSSGTEVSEFLVAVIIIVFSLIYMAEVISKKRLRDIRYPLILGYLVRIALMFFDIFGTHIFQLPNSGADSVGYYNRSVLYANGINTADQVGMFSTLMGTIFSQCGISRLLGQFFIVLFSVVTMHMAGAIMNELRINEKNRQIGMYILCLLPNFAILSSIFLRESIITMFVTISLYYFVKWYNTKKEGYFVIAFAMVFLGALFHAGVVGLAVGYIAVRMLYDNKRNRLKFSIKGMIFAALFLFVFIYLFNNYKDMLFAKMKDTEEIADIASVSTIGGSDYSAYVGDSSTPLNMVIYTIPRIVYFLFSPFPWQWRGLDDIIAFCFSSMFYMFALIHAVRYLLNGKQENTSIVVVLLILAMCMTFVFAWGVSNSGTAIRHRDKMVILYGVLFALTGQ